jgi:uncharacterized protein
LETKFDIRSSLFTQSKRSIEQSVVKRKYLWRSIHYSLLTIPYPLAPVSIVNQQYLKKFGIACGIVGILLLGCSLPGRSVPPIQIKNSLTQSTTELKPTPLGQKLPVSAQVTIAGQSIQLEVARTAQEQSTGLMYRTELAPNRGMLFVFSPPRPVSFWMKNTLIPLDMVFMSNGVVKYIGEKIPPCTGNPCPGYGPEPKIDIDGVLELRSGRAAELRLKVGDRLKFRNYSAKKLK